MNPAAELDLALGLALLPQMISLAAHREDLSLREAATKLGFVTGEQFDSWVRPEKMTRPLGGER